MPTFRTAKPNSIAAGVAALFGSSPNLSAKDMMVAELAGATLNQRNALAQKVMEEVKAMREQQALQNDPAKQAEFAAFSSGVEAPQALQFARSVRGEAIPPLTPNDDEGNPMPAAPFAMPENLSDEQKRSLFSNFAAQYANRFATGKTNAAQLAQAGGEYQGQDIVRRVQELIAQGNVQGASAVSQGGKLGQQIKLFDNVGDTGATYAPATGAVQADPAGNPLLAATIDKKKKEHDESAKLRSILTAAGIDPASPQGQQLFRAQALKMATHQPAASTNVTLRQETEEAKAVGKALGESFNDIQKAGADAGGKISRYSRLEQLLDGVNTGKLTPAGTELAAWAEAVGIKVDPNLGNKQAIRALGNEIALQLRNPSGGAGMPGAMSDKDREFLVQMTPSLGLTPEGNKMLIETAKKLAKRDQDVARLARDYRQKRGSLGPGFFEELQRFSDSNPLFSGKGATENVRVINGTRFIRQGNEWYEDRRQ